MARVSRPIEDQYRPHLPTGPDRGTTTGATPPGTNVREKSDNCQVRRNAGPSSSRLV
jgi:hypothetical protein